MSLEAGKTTGLGVRRPAESPEIIDLQFQGVSGVIGAFLIGSGQELALIESGPTSTLPVLLAALEPYGGVKRLSWVAVTHVHLDHAGGVGALLERAPNARCYVHSTGRRHLVDPSRLLRSASRIYGDQMDALWGEVAPAPGDRVVGLEDGDTIRVGDAELEVLYTPGHATHHIALFHEPSRTMYTGDAAGVRLRGTEEVRPPTPPPDLDPRLWKESVAKMRSRQPERLILTHYGVFEEDLDHHFSNMLERLDHWIDVVRRGREIGQEPVTFVDSLQREGDAEVAADGGDSMMLRQYELASPYGMTVSGIIRYLEQAPQPPE